MAAKSVLVTGGTGFFGRAIAEDLLKNSWQVVITTRSLNHSTEMIQELGTLAADLEVIEFDYFDSGGVEGLLRKLDRVQISITHLVNNARSKDSLRVDEDGVTISPDFSKEFELDVVFPYELSVALARSERHALQAIVNIGSQYGIVAPNPNLDTQTLKSNPIQYGVSKAALHHMTRELAVRLSNEKIRVNCVAFGGVEGRVSPNFLARYSSMLPLGRMLKISEVPGPVRFLLSDDATSVTGHVLVADGGWSIV